MSATSFFHGVTVSLVDVGARTIAIPSSSIIGLVDIFEPDSFELSPLKSGDYSLGIDAIDGEGGVASEQVFDFTNINIRHIAKIIPSSSAIAEKIKSASTKGMDSGVPLYKPRPNQPPLDIANRDCVI